MSRFTVKDLRSGIDGINGWLADAGAMVRFEVHGRNGYQAVDEYNVDDDGNRVGSGVNRMVGSGTSKEACNQAYLDYKGIMRLIERDKQTALKEIINSDGITVEDIRNACNE